MGSVTSSYLQPPESSELTHDPLLQEQGCGLAPLPWPGLSSKDLTPWERGGLVIMWCVVVLLRTPAPPQPSSPHSHLFSPPAQLTAEKEESLDSLELYVRPGARVNNSLHLDTTLSTELDSLLETPTTEAMLDNILAETDYIDNKWTQQLDDLFPELD